MLLLCTQRIGRPASANSRSQNTRARYPRSSPRRSTSMIAESGSFVRVKITASAYGDRRPAQLAVESAGLLQRLHVLNAQAALAREVLIGHAPLGIGTRELLGAALDRPLRRRRRQHARELRTVDAIGALVRLPAARRERRGRAGDLGDDLGDLADHVVLCGGA